MEVERGLVELFLHSESDSVLAWGVWCYMWAFSVALGEAEPMSGNFERVRECLQEFQMDNHLPGDTLDDQTSPENAQVTPDGDEGKEMQDV